MKRGQKGFGAVEGLLILIAIGLIGFVCWFVFHAKNNANSTYNNTAAVSQSAKPTAVSELTLQSAVKQTQNVYDRFQQYIDTGNVSPSYNIDYINAHKTWFSAAFLANANSNNASSNGYHLICEGGSVKLNGFIVTGLSSNSQSATVRVQEKLNNIPYFKLPVSLTVAHNSWVINSVDLSSCSQ